METGDGEAAAQAENSGAGRGGRDGTAFLVSAACREVQRWEGQASSRAVLTRDREAGSPPAGSTRQPLIKRPG